MIAPQDKCPQCGAGSLVINSRTRDDGTVRRRRECKECGHRWTISGVTFEAAQSRAELSLIVNKLAVRLKALEGELVELVDELRKQ